MTISQRMHDAFTEQIKDEFYSAYVYLSMAAYFEMSNLPGMAGWMRAQAREEAGHAVKIFDHLLDRNAKVQLRPIPQPPTDFLSPAEVFAEAHRREQQVTASIHELYGAAVDERDFPSRVFLDWFVQEQVEEEKTVGLIAEQLKMLGGDRPGLLMLDRELGRRTPADQEVGPAT